MATVSESSMPALRINLKRMADGSAALTCTRRDGSVIWQRQPGQRGLVFPMHDLTHYAVETVLGSRQGFFGLLAAGWEFGDFAAPWPRGPIPAEARDVEVLVGLFESERRMGGGWTSAELRAQGELYAAAQRSAGKVATMPELSDENAVRIHALLEKLLARWAATRPGETLEFAFDCRGATA